MQTLYREFARRGTHLYEHDFAAFCHAPWFPFAWRGIEKNKKQKNKQTKQKNKTKNASTFDLVLHRKKKFQPSVCANILVTQLKFSIVV